MDEGPMNSHDAPARISGILCEAEQLIEFGYSDGDGLRDIPPEAAVVIRALVAEVQRLQAEQEQRQKERDLLGCGLNEAGAAMTVAWNKARWEPSVFTPEWFMAHYEAFQDALVNHPRLKAYLELESRLAAVEQEKAQLQERCDVLEPGARNYNPMRLRAEKAETTLAAVEQAIRTLLEQNSGPTGGDTDAGEPDTHVLVRIEDFKALEKVL